MIVAVFTDFLRMLPEKVHGGFKLVAERPGGIVLSVIAYCSWVDKGTLGRKCCGEKRGCNVCVAEGDGLVGLLKQVWSIEWKEKQGKGNQCQIL